MIDHEDRRIAFLRLQLQAKLGDPFLQQLFVAEVGPIGGFHAPSVTRALRRSQARRHGRKLGKLPKAGLKHKALDRECRVEALEET